MSTVEELAVDLVVKRNLYERMQYLAVPLDTVLRAKQEVAFLRAQRDYLAASEALATAIAGET